MSQYKLCPKCKSIASLNTAKCSVCAHRFRTVFPGHPFQPIQESTRLERSTPPEYDDQYSQTQQEVTTEEILQNIVHYLDYLASAGPAHLSSEDYQRILFIQDALQKTHEEHQLGKNWATGMAAGVGFLFGGPILAAGLGAYANNMSNQLYDECRRLREYAEMKLIQVKQKYQIAILY